MQLGRGESIEDTAKVLSRMVDAVMIRANRHEDVERFAQHSSMPVINGLTDKSHPCQILADLMTFEEHRGPITGKTHRLGRGRQQRLLQLHPRGAQARLQAEHRLPGGLPSRPLRSGPRGRAAGPGRDDRRPARGRRSAPTAWSPTPGCRWATPTARTGWTALEPLSGRRGPDGAADSRAVFLHCLPAHRGEEVTDAVIDGPQSLVWDEAENRIHAQKSILAWCFGAIG
jgi:ornithine carbamoyltransferase